jgi:hypothetical protein
MAKKKKTKKQKPSSPSNADIEMRWVDAWNDLYDLAGKRRIITCLLPDGSVVDLEGGKEWLQNSVYEGYLVMVERGYVLRRPGAILLRSKQELP